MKKKQLFLIKICKRIKRYFISLLYTTSWAGGICTRKKNGNLEILCICHKKWKLMLPKWGSKKGEKLTDTAKREFSEETGIFDCVIGKYIWTARDSKRLKKTHFYHVEKYWHQHYHLQDEATQWIDYRTAMSLMRHKSEKKILGKFISRTFVLPVNRTFKK